MIDVESGIIGAMALPRVASYRIQLTPSFGFAAAAAVVPDLARLGVSHVYLSPVAEAVTDSTHGYDVVDPAEVRAQLGGAAGLRRLAQTARDHGLGIVIDIVPNHVATTEPERNEWWWLMLRDGPTGRTADHFDVDWDVADGRVILPVLGRPLREAVEAGEVVVDGDRLRYFDRTFPLRPAPEADGDGDEGTDVAALAGRQHYVLQHWREPRRNVRRFFTIDDLVAIRPEVPAVARAVHETVAGLAADGLLDGVRVDHVDGLADPAAYLRELRRVVGDDAWLVVEKILVGDERLPADWAADGTTGYEWITLVDHVFTHPDGERTLTESWRAGTGDALTYHDHEIAGVRDVLDTALRPDLERVARTTGDPSPTVERAIIELTARLGRYRTYLVEDEGAVGPGDRDVVIGAAERAAGDLDEAGRARLDALVERILAGTELTRRWQQLTGPALAKGGEDRALYRSLRLSAHNEVGGDPGVWSRSVDELHRHNEHVAGTCPSTMLAGSTHDTKRAEDVRARLLVLSEIPDRWASAVEAWRVLAEGTGALDLDAVGGPMLVLAFQTAVGAWPIDAGRLGQYLVKASREADRLTTWSDPDAHHEEQLRRLAALLTDGELSSSVADLVDSVAPAGRAVSLAQLALRLTAPGVPDLYQASESWLLTLVDPDNRAPIDPRALRAAAERAETPTSVWTSDAPKTALLARVLGTRRRNAACFAPGARYAALPTSGVHGDHVIAFARRPAPDGGDRPITTVASRFPLSRPDGWGDTTVDLPTVPSRDVLRGPGAPAVGGPTRLADLLGDHPAAVLEPVARGV